MTNSDPESAKRQGEHIADEMSGQVFVRRASGLVRDFSTFDLFVVNMADCCVGFSFLTGALWAASLYPDAYLTPLILAGALMLVFVGIVYSLFAAAMPRSGGDYVWVGRTLNPLLGFIANWAQTWGMILAGGLFAWLFIDTVASILLTAGLQFDNPTLQSIGESLGGSGALFGLGTLVIVLVTGAQLVSKKFLRTLLAALFWIAMISLVIHLYFFITASHETFVANFNTLMAQYTGSEDSYNFIINLAREQGNTSTPLGTWAGTLIALPLAFQFYIGFTSTAYVAGEAKEPMRSQPIAILGTLAVSLLVLLVGMSAMYRVAGRDFINGLAYLDGLGENPVPVGVYSTFFSGLVSESPVLELISAIGMLAWPLMLVIVLMMLPVRNLFAWSVDSLLPEAITKVDRRGTPVIATLVIAFATWIIMILYLFTTIFELSLGLTAVTSVGFILVGISAAIFPYQRQDLYDRSPGIVRTLLGKTPLLVVSGVLMSMIYAFVFYSAVITEGFGLPAWIFTILLFAVAIGIYYGAHTLRRRQGVNMDLMWKELPPD
ncbi:MAG: APC family permease [Anaerolineales bacterium]|nr:APC family permease [Anaerolineales bacterium]